MVNLIGFSFYDKISKEERIQVWNKKTGKAIGEYTKENSPKCKIVHSIEIFNLVMQNIPT